MRSESGRDLGGAGSVDTLRRAELTGRGDLAHVGYWAEPAWSDGEAELVFRELPPGEYRLWLHWSRGSLRITPEELLVRVPGGGLDVLVHDLVETETFTLAARSSAGEDSVWLALRWVGEHGTVDVWTPRTVPEGWPPPDPAYPTHQFAGPFPAGGRVEGEVWAPGHQRAWIPDEAFLPTERGGHREALVEIEPGWSARFTVFERSPEPGSGAWVDGERLEGIVLALDGLELPPTGAVDHPAVRAGRVIHGAGAKPRALQVVTPGWELVEHHSLADYWGTVFAGTGEFTVEDGELDVILRRR